ncbi:MAG: sugar phosphate isomerase/epimerase [Oscillospiraceae bacterium]|nr:sugar phosphate isomerase/epimerase [Oscillospiraceae bacterium]
MQFTFYSNFAEMVKEKGIKAAAEYAQRMGFSSVEMLELGAPVTITTLAEAREAKKVLADHGLHMACYSVGTTLYQSPEMEAALMKEAEIAAELGSPFLHHTLILAFAMQPGMPSFEDGIAYVTDAAERVANYAKTLGIKCIYEDQGMYANGIEGFGTFFNEMKRRCDNVGVCGDVGNSYFVDVESDAFFEAFADDIVHVHIKDYIRKTGPVAPGKDWYPTRGGNWLRDTTVGSGCVNFPAIMKTLKRINYTGPYALELCHPEPFDYGVKQAMEYLSALE